MISELFFLKLLKLNFGKHKGRTLEEIYKEDNQYFMWLKNNDKTEERLKKACETIITDKTKEINKDSMQHQ